jgi:RNA polymerase sigma factor (sigma-70 family)
VIVLRYLQELPVRRISNVLGISPNAVEVRLTRARRRLANALPDLAEDLL